MTTSSQKLAASKSTLISWVEQAAREVGGIPSIALGMILPMAEPLLDRYVQEATDDELDQLLVKGAHTLLNHLSDGHPGLFFATTPAQVDEFAEATGVELEAPSE